MRWLGRLLGGWALPTKVVAGVMAAVLIGLGVALPLMLGTAGGRTATSRGGLSPGVGSPSGTGTQSVEPATTTGSPPSASTTRSVPVTTPLGAQALSGSHTAVPSPSPTSTGGSGSIWRWYEQNLPAGTNALADVSCVAGGFCLAVKNSVVSTSDGGATWKLMPMPSIKSGDYLAAVSCVTSTVCWTASFYGLVFKTTDGGRSWVQESVPAGVTQITALYCLDLDHCWAAAVDAPDTVIRTVDGGATWVTSNLPREGSEALGIACPTVTVCWASGAVQVPNQSGQLEVEGVIFGSSDGGANWSVAQIYSSEYGSVLIGMSCANPDDCAAAGNLDGSNGLLVTTTDGGTQWTKVAIPDTIPTLDSVSCSGSGCFSDGGEPHGSPPGSDVILRNSWGSANTTTVYSTTTDSLAGIYCQTSGDCWVTGTVSHSQSGAMLAYGTG